ncbi:hypothetical protein B0F90DRAFT_1670195 [Multifurca ochricompacta]|uniref:Uncharacterized protein n=1 Tax=Multifurca ochricompacta TaxID=376703 RepID=A0AAD4LZ04_9AGAM|nr:hypothetical protein B0F90DRAFT_1670195 [Multifurca ochricompacta]
MSLEISSRMTRRTSSVVAYGSAELLFEFLADFLICAGNQELPFGLSFCCSREASMEISSYLFELCCSGSGVGGGVEVHEVLEHGVDMLPRGVDHGVVRVDGGCIQARGPRVIC